MAYAPTRNVVDVDVSFFLFSIASFDAALFPNDTFFEPANGELSLDDCALLALGEPSSVSELCRGLSVRGSGVSKLRGEGGGELDDCVLETFQKSVDVKVGGRWEVHSIPMSVARCQIFVRVSLYQERTHQSRPQSPCARVERVSSSTEARELNL